MSFSISELKVQEVYKGSKGTKRPKRYLKVQEIPKGPRGIRISKRYLKVQEVTKGPRGSFIHSFLYFAKKPPFKRCTDFVRGGRVDITQKNFTMKTYNDKPHDTADSSTPCRD